MSAPITDRPILFSAPMVRALLAGTKTQTRRVMKPQPSAFVPSPNRHATKRDAAYLDAYCSESKTPQNPRGMSDRWCWWTPDERQGADWIRCPYGAPGDTLWVRESFTVDDIRYLSGPLTEASSRVIDRADIYYRADGECCAQIPECQCSESGKVRWRPSIHMPRWASRISLRVTSVRVERVQDISEEDALAEGIKPWGPAQRGVYGMTLENIGPVYPAPAADIIAGGESWTTSAARSFRGLWVSINGAESWEANPWVWVVGFERVESAVLAQIGRAS